MVTRPAVPRPATATGWTAGALIALYPAMLPRSPWWEAALVVALGTVGLLVARLAARRATPAGPDRTRWCAVAAAVLSVAAVVGWVCWQDLLRSAAGTPPVTAAGIAGLLATVLLPFGCAAIPARIRRRALTVAAAGTVVLGTAAPALAAPEGPRFLAAESATPGARVYVGVGEGDATGRAERAVDRLIAAGGLHRRAIAVALPTGSGWVDAHFLHGIEEATGGTVVTLAVQYTAEPSWRSYLLHRDRVIEQADALAAALHRRLPTGAPPILVYGQSLGAIGAAEFTRAATGLGLPVAGTVLAGTPAGVTDPPGPVTRLLNRSDPVGVFSAELALHPPHTPPDGGTDTPRPPWLPGVSWLQTAADLLGAIDQPAGTGHRYDDTQGRVLAGYLRGQAMGPRAAS